MLSALLDNLYRGISAPLQFLDTLFSRFGLSLVLLLTVMFVITFVINNFIRIFFSSHV